VKRDAVLDATRALVIDGGFAAVTIEGVATRAGVSKVTIYNQFTDRTGLFTALIARETQWMEAGMTALAAPGATLRDRLVALEQGLTAFWARADVIRMDAQMVLAGDEHAALRGAFFNAGPAALEHGMTAMLAGLPDPPATARTLIALWRGVLPDATRFGTAPPPDGATRAAATIAAIDLVLRTIDAPPGTL
jgi:TetR/AcrR family transcriptional regulator, mexJK operon transcriptional repressor